MFRLSFFFTLCFMIKSLCGGGAFFAAPGYNRVIKVKILKQIILISVVSGSLT